MRISVLTRFNRRWPRDRRCFSDFRRKNFDSLEDAFEYLKFRLDHLSERTFRVDLSVEFDKDEK